MKNVRDSVPYLTHCKVSADDDHKFIYLSKVARAWPRRQSTASRFRNTVSLASFASRRTKLRLINLY